MNQSTQLISDASSASVSVAASPIQPSLSSISSLKHPSYGAQSRKLPIKPLPSLLEGGGLKSGASKTSASLAEGLRSKITNELYYQSDSVTVKLREALGLANARKLGLGNEAVTLSNFHKKGGFASCAQYIVMHISTTNEDHDTRQMTLQTQFKQFCDVVGIDFDESLYQCVASICKDKSLSASQLQEAASLSQCCVGTSTKCRSVLTVLQASLLCKHFPRWLALLSEDALIWSAEDRQLHSEIEEASRLLRINAIVSLYCGAEARDLFRVDNPRHSFQLLKYVAKHYERDTVLEDIFFLCNTFHHLSSTDALLWLLQNAITMECNSICLQLMEKVMNKNSTLAMQLLPQLVMHIENILRETHTVINNNDISDDACTIMKTRAKSAAKCAVGLLTLSTECRSMYRSDGMWMQGSPDSMHIGSSRQKAFACLCELQETFDVYLSADQMNDLHRVASDTSDLWLACSEGRLSSGGTGVHLSFQHLQKACSIIAKSMKEDCKLGDNAIMSTLLSVNTAKTVHDHVSTLHSPQDDGVAESVVTATKKLITSGNVTDCQVTTVSLLHIAHILIQVQHGSNKYSSFDSLIQATSMIQDYLVQICPTKMLPKVLTLATSLDQFAQLCFHADEGVGERLEGERRLLLMGRNISVCMNTISGMAKEMAHGTDTESKSNSKSNLTQHNVLVNARHLLEQPQLHPGWFVGDGLLTPPSIICQLCFHSNNNMLASGMYLHDIVELLNMAQERASHMLVTRTLTCTATRIATLPSKSVGREIDIVCGHLDTTLDETLLSLAERSLGGTSIGITSGIVDCEMALSMLCALPARASFSIYKSALPMAIQTGDYHRVLQLANIGKAIGGSATDVLPTACSRFVWNQSSFSDQCRQISVRSTCWYLLRIRGIDFDPLKTMEAATAGGGSGGGSSTINNEYQGTLDTKVSTGSDGREGTQHNRTSYRNTSTTSSVVNESSYNSDRFGRSNHHSRKGEPTYSTSLMIQLLRGMISTMPPDKCLRLAADFACAFGISLDRMIEEFTEVLLLASPQPLQMLPSRAIGAEEAAREDNDDDKGDDVLISDICARQNVVSKTNTGVSESLSAGANGSATACDIVFAGVSKADTLALKSVVLKSLKLVRSPARCASILRKCVVTIESDPSCYFNYELHLLVLNLYKQSLESILQHRQHSHMHMSDAHCYEDEIEIIDRKRDILTILSSYFCDDHVIPRPNVSDLIAPLSESSGLGSELEPESNMRVRSCQPTKISSVHVLGNKRVGKASFDPLSALEATFSQHTDTSNLAALTPLCLPLGLPQGYVHARILVVAFERRYEAGKCLPSFESDVFPVLDRLRSARDRAALAEWCAAKYITKQVEEDALRCFDYSLQALIDTSSESELRHSSIRGNDSSEVDGEVESLERIRSISASRSLLLDRVKVKSIVAKYKSQPCFVGADAVFESILLSIGSSADDSNGDYNGDDSSVPIQSTPERLIHLVLSRSTLVLADLCLSHRSALSIEDCREALKVISEVCHKVADSHSHICLDTVIDRIVHLWLLNGDEECPLGQMSIEGTGVHARGRGYARKGMHDEKVTPAATRKRAAAAAATSEALVSETESMRTRDRSTAAAAAAVPAFSLDLTFNTKGDIWERPSRQGKANGSILGNVGTGGAVNSKVDTEEEPSCMMPCSPREISELKVQRSSIRIALLLCVKHYCETGIVGNNTENIAPSSLPSALSFTPTFLQDTESPSSLSSPPASVSGSGSVSSTSGSKLRRIGLLSKLDSKRESKSTYAVQNACRSLLSIVFAKHNDLKSFVAHDTVANSVYGIANPLLSTTFAMRHRALRAAALLCPQEELERALSDLRISSSTPSPGAASEAATGTATTERGHSSLLTACSFGSFVAKEMEEMRLPLPHTDLIQLSTMHFQSYARSLWRYHRESNLSGKRGRFLLLLLELYLQEKIETDYSFVLLILDELTRCQYVRSLLLAAEAIYTHRSLHAVSAQVDFATVREPLKFVFTHVSEEIKRHNENVSADDDEDNDRLCYNALQTLRRAVEITQGWAKDEGVQTMLQNVLDQMLQLTSTSLVCGENNPLDKLILQVERYMRVYKA
jgi:hypothetical protein